MLRHLYIWNIPSAQTMLDNNDDNDEDDENDEDDD